NNNGIPNFAGARYEGGKIARYGRGEIWTVLPLLSE
nr:hypothetical protein [Tanacetum cinerariifolium]